MVDETGNVTYDVEQILAHQVERKTARQRKAGYKYLVKWEGYPLWACTWEPESQFAQGNIVLADYKAQHGLG